MGEKINTLAVTTKVRFLSKQPENTFQIHIFYNTLYPCYPHEHKICFSLHAKWWFWPSELREWNKTIIFTFAYKALPNQAPQHICTVVTVRWLVKCLLHKWMTMSPVIIIRVDTWWTAWSVRVCLGCVPTVRHLNASIRASALPSAFHRGENILCLLQHLKRHENTGRHVCEGLEP